MNICRHDLVHCAVCQGLTEPYEPPEPATKLVRVRPDGTDGVHRILATPASSRERPYSFPTLPASTRPKSPWSDPAVTHYGRVSRNKVWPKVEPQPQQRTYASATAEARAANEALAARLGVSL